MDKRELTEPKKNENFKIEGDDEEMGDESPSILKIMIDNQDSIEKTVSLIRAETISTTFRENDVISGTNKVVEKVAVTRSPAAVPAPSVNRQLSMQAGSSSSFKQFDGMKKLLTDTNVRSLISNIAGQDTQRLIDQTMNSIDSGKSMNDKHKAFSEGIKKLQANLNSADKATARDDPAFKLALSLTGLSKDKLGLI